MKPACFHKTTILMAVLVWHLGFHASAQQANTQYLLHGTPQTSFLNPAVQIGCRWFVGIPALSSAHFSYSNTAFTYRDLSAGNRWNLEKVESQMHRVDFYGSELSLQLLAVGYRHKSSFYTFSVDEKAYLYQTVPLDLASVLVNGNGPAVGSYASFNAFRPYGSYLRQFSLGASRVVDRNLTAGFRIKLLFGKAGIYTGRSRVGLQTDESYFALQADGTYVLKSSMPVTVEQDGDGNITSITWNEIQYRDFLLNRGNAGIAVDLGIIYRYNPRLILSASLLDLGGIRWGTDINTLSSEGTLIYKGIEGSGAGSASAFLDEIIDTLQSSYTISLSQDPFMMLTPAQLFLGGSYRMREHLSLGLVNRNLFLRSKVHSSLTFSATADYEDRFSGTVSWSYLNRSLENIGLAITRQGPGFQFFLATDNVLGFFRPFDTRTLNLRAGCNLLLGCPRNKKEQMESASYRGIPAGGDCSWTDSQKQRKKRYKKAGLR